MVTKDSLRFFKLSSPKGIGRAGFRCIVCVLAVTISTSWACPAAATEDNSGAWLIFTTTDSFGAGGADSRWRYWFDAQARYFDPGSGISQYLVRPAVGYRVGDNATVWAGYARFRSRNRSGETGFENRYWQQFDWTAGRWKGGTFTMRTRLEQRSVSAGDDLGLVLRFQTKYVRPIGSDGKTSLVLGLEPFVDLKDTDWGGSSGIAQNRTFVGVSWRVSDRLSVETGYLNQYIWVDSREDRVNHLGSINFKVNL